MSSLFQHKELHYIVATQIVQKITEEEKHTITHKSIVRDRVAKLEVTSLHPFYRYYIGGY